MAAHIRAARMEDYRTLDQIMRRASLALPEYQEILLANPDSIHLDPAHIEANRVLVAEFDGILAGFTAWLPIGDSTAEIDALFVDPPFWKRSVGSSLMAALCKAVTEAGLKKLYVVVPPEAVEFYRRCGFDRAGVTATAYGPAATMMKEIADLG